MSVTIGTSGLTERAAELELEIKPMAGHIGAEILGVDLREASAPVVDLIRSTLLEWKVVFFRDQQLSREQHVSFGRMFGEVTPAHPTLPALFPDQPEILLLDSRQKTNTPGKLPQSCWHTDATFVVNPPTGSILRGVVVPEYGGDTQWTNLAIAYETLSQPVRDLIDNLHAVHHNALPPGVADERNELRNAFYSTELRSVHPVVRVHPETGERCLFVNPQFTSHILELSRAEGRHVLELLFEHMTNPAFTVRFRWQAGSIAFWDNRATAHLIPTDVPPGVHRSMERITIAGDVPVGVDDATSYALVGQPFS
jgi:taurine dioxygenase